MSQQDIQSDMESRRTVFPQRQVIHLWANACAKDLRGGNVSTVTASRNGETQPGAVLRSYAASIGNRLPATVRTPDGFRIFLIRPGFYSNTTRKHCGWAAGSIPQRATVESRIEWDGTADGLLQSVSFSSCYALAAFVFNVPRVEPWNGADHAVNLAALHAHACEALNGLRKALKHGNPARVAEAFAVADYYRRTFTPEAAPLAIPADAPAILAAFRKRQAAAAAREAAATAALAGSRTAWLAAFARTAAAIRAAYAAAVAGQSSAATLAEKITEWEAGGQWPAEDSDPEAVETLRRTVRALLAGQGNEAREHSAVPQAVRAALPCPATVHLRGAWPEGKGARRDYGSDRAFWDACGVEPYSFKGYHFNNATDRAGRNLVRLSADGAEVITSGGARVPASIARALWKRYGALMSEAATAEAAPAFPGVDGAAIPFGPFAWTGWEAATPEARASGGGAWALRVGCHRICAADLCRMAARHAWEGGAK